MPRPKRIGHGVYLGLLFASLLCPLSYSAEVVQLTSDPKVVGISGDRAKPYSSGETICFERSGEALGCGVVTRIFKKGAAVELENPVAIQIGDRVVNRGPASIEETSADTSANLNATSRFAPKGKNLIGRVNVGVNYPDYSTTQSTYTKLFSYLIGIGAEIPISSAFSFEPGIYYSPEWVTAVSSTATAKVAINYLEIPFYFKYRPFHKSKNKISPYLMAGPSYGYLLSASLAYEGYDTPETDLTSLLNSSRFSVNHAIGFDTQVTETLSMGFSIRYLFAISSPTRGTSTSSSARLFQGVISMGWDYEQDVFD